MNDSQHGRAWRVAAYLGLVSEKPKPSPRQSFIAFLRTLPFVIMAALAAAAVDGAGGPDWLTLALVVSPIWVLIAILSRSVRAADARQQQREGEGA